MRSTFGLNESLFSFDLVSEYFLLETSFTFARQSILEPSGRSKGGWYILQGLQLGRMD